MKGTPEIPKELCRGHRTITQAVENITKMRTRSKGKKALIKCFLDMNVK